MQVWQFILITGLAVFLGLGPAGAADLSNAEKHGQSNQAGGPAPGIDHHQAQPRGPARLRL